MCTLEIGIDPGKEGAIAIKSEKEVEIIKINRFVDKKNRRYEINRLYNFFEIRKDRYDSMIVYIEKQWGRPGISAKANSSIMEGYTIFRTIFEILCIHYVEINPAEWKKKIFGEGKHDKDDSIKKAVSMYPDVKIGRNHNIAEALLILKYGRELKDVRVSKK